MSQIDKSSYRTLSFDCYGTLIDWENGLLGYLQPLLESVDVHVLDSWVLELFAEQEPLAQAEGGSYRSVLGQVLRAFARRLAFTANDEMENDFAESMEYWLPFDDTVAELRRLAQQFELVIVSNVDEALFEHSARQLPVPFAHVITAEETGVYKPDPAMFDTLVARAQGPVLHVAQSRFHDIVPAAAAGLDTVWIDRPGTGAARPVDASPKWTFTSLAAFADDILT